jgi:hypothetical protein
MLNRLFFLCLFCGQSQLYAQQQNNAWNTLAQVTIRQEKHKTGGYMVDVPSFSTALLLLNGKPITLKGYMIPLQELRQQYQFVFSRYPFALCYFCGAAGIETVVEVRSRQAIKFTEDNITLKGILKLNPQDTAHLLYILEDAEIIPKVEK